jgi:signal transduction histidine kinase
MVQASIQKYSQGYLQNSSFSGTGLGLYISRNIIEPHGGKIWAQNNNCQEKSGRCLFFQFTIKGSLEYSQR